MAVTATPIFPQTIVNSPVTIVNADASNKKTVYTGGTNGSKVENILITNTDTVAYLLQFFFTISATDYLIASVNIPASSGNLATVVCVNPMATSTSWGPALNLDANGNPYLYIANGTTLKAASTTTVTAAKTITIVAQGGDF